MQRVVKKYMVPENATVVIIPPKGAPAPKAPPAPTQKTPPAPTQKAPEKAPAAPAPAAPKGGN